MKREREEERESEKKKAPVNSGKWENYKKFELYKMSSNRNQIGNGDHKICGTVKTTNDPLRNYRLNSQQQLRPIIDFLEAKGSLENDPPSDIIPNLEVNAFSSLFSLFSFVFYITGSVGSLPN